MFGVILAFSMQLGVASVLIHGRFSLALWLFQVNSSCVYALGFAHEVDVRY